jgi:replicative DNA helicase
MTETPSAPLAEKRILSIMLQEPAKWIPQIISDGITADFFFAHRHAWSLIIDRFQSGLSLDPVHVYESEKSNDRLTGIGGMAGFVEIFTFSAGVPGASYTHDITLLREAAVKRTAYIAGNALQGVSDAWEASEAMGAAEDLLNALRAIVAKPKGMVTADAAGTEFYRRLISDYENGYIPGRSTGIAIIDEASGGMRDGELWVIGAETSGGKSVLMLQFLQAVITAGSQGLLFTAELMASEIIGRLCSLHGRISYGEITQPRTMGQMTMGKLGSTVEDIKRLPLLIQDRPSMTIDQIEADCTRYRDTQGQIGIIVADYLQIIRLESASRRNMNREQENAEVSIRLKQLAKEMRCPVVTAVQLNDDGKVRESRAPSFDADNVLYITDDGIVAKKMRNAKRGETLPLFLNGLLQRFQEGIAPQREKEKSSKSWKK